MDYRGCSYEKRVKEVNEVYDKHSRSGLSNRAIWRRFIYPFFGISEKTFYNYINALGRDEITDKIEKLTSRATYKQQTL